MDAHLFKLFWENAEKVLLGARVGKIQEPVPGLLTIDIFNQGKKRQLCWHYGKQRPFCFLSEDRLAASHAPSANIMRIRKYFANRYITSVVSQFCSRRLWLMPALGSGEKSATTVWLCLDLMRGPALHFNTSLDVPETDSPDWPKPEQLQVALGDWRAWPVLTPALRKKLGKLPEEEQWALMEDLRVGGGCLFLQKDQDNRIISASAWPAGENEETICEESPGDGAILTGFARAGQALIFDHIFTQANERLSSPVKKQLARLKKLLAKLDQDETRLLAMREKENNARCIAANLWRLNSTNHAKSIILNCEGQERSISLDERFSIQQNMEKFFHAAKRGKRGLTLLQERREETLQKINSLSGGQSAVQNQKADSPDQKLEKPVTETLIALRQSLPNNISSQISSDGYIILCGRDAKGNAAIRRFAAPHDLWAHVEQGPGAHIVIRRSHPGHIIPESTLDEAGKLAAQKSWLKNSSSASIMYAEVRHVHADRNGPPGKVLIDRLAMTRIVDL